MASPEPSSVSKGYKVEVDEVILAVKEANLDQVDDERSQEQEMCPLCLEPLMSEVLDCEANVSRVRGRSKRTPRSLSFVPQGSDKSRREHSEARGAGPAVGLFFIG